MTVLLKRAYAPPAAEDGMRVLVDRLWPRGLSKDEAHIDVWMKDIAPSSALRRWFNHDPANGSCSSRNILKSWKAPPRWKNFAVWRGAAALRFCLQRATSSTTTPSPFRAC